MGRPGVGRDCSSPNCGCREKTDHHAQSGEVGEVELDLGPGARGVVHEGGKELGLR